MNEGHKRVTLAGRKAYTSRDNVALSRVNSLVEDVTKLTKCSFAHGGSGKRMMAFFPGQLFSI